MVLTRSTSRSCRARSTEAFENPVPADKLLLKADGYAVGVVAEPLVHAGFLGRQPCQRGPRRRRLPAPSVAVREKRLLIHQHTLHMRMNRAELVQDSEAVRVDVTPVQDRAISQPSGFPKRRKPVPSSIDGQR